MALLRLGRYVGLRGPGLFLIVPVIESLSPFVDQRVRVAKRDAGADPVGAVAPAEDVREPLAEPPLDAFRGHNDEFLGERIRQRIGQ